MSALHLSKYHATGNDFLVTLAGDEPPLSAAEVVALCDRHRGIGADGVITVGAPPGGSDVDCTFHLRNADGGEAEMSGNGMRCLAALAARCGIGRVAELHVLAGVRRRDVTLTRDRDGHVVAADVDMGAPTFEPAAIPFTGAADGEIDVEVDGAHYTGVAVGMGNPHLVLFVEDVDTVPVARHGALLEHDARFPRRTNVEWVVARDRGHAAMRVRERGVGETLSCGTGACAAAAALSRRGLVDSCLTMHVPGGDLTIAIHDTIRLGGPVAHVFDVDIDRDRLA